MNRADALKSAEELIERLSPSRNARGYAEAGAPKLAERVSEILRVAEYLLADGEKDAPAPAPARVYPLTVTDNDGDTWTLIGGLDPGRYVLNGDTSELTYDDIERLHGIRATH